MDGNKKADKLEFVSGSIESKEPGEIKSPKWYSSDFDNPVDPAPDRTKLTKLNQLRLSSDTTAPVLCPACGENLKQDKRRNKMSICRRIYKHVSTFKEGRSYSINLHKARNMRRCLDKSIPMKPKQVFITLTNKAQLKRFKFSYRSGILHQRPNDNNEHTQLNFVATEIKSYQK